MKQMRKKNQFKAGTFFKKEIDKKYKGFRFVVLGLSMGHRCGYVQIPKGHILFGKDYSEQLPITFQKISKLIARNFKEEDRIGMDLLFDVHDGITFSGNLKDFNGYWIGFDCNHAGDAKDFNLMGEEEKRIWSSYRLYELGDIVRTTSYVEKECKRLIDQIIKYFPAKQKRREVNPK